MATWNSLEIVKLVVAALTMVERWQLIEDSSLNRRRFGAG